MSMKIDFGAIYQHVKRRSTYEVIGRARMQIGFETIGSQRERLERMTYIVYRSIEDDTLWVRPETEFCDGRFEKVS